MTLQNSINAIIAAQSSEHELPGEEPDVIVIETKTDVSLDRTTTALTAALSGVRFTAAPVFENADGELARFIAVSLPNVRLSDMPGGPFALAHQLFDELDLASSDPLFQAPASQVLYGEPEIIPVSEETAAAADREWHLVKTKVPEAWAFSQSEGRPVGGEGIVVAQPDTGRAGHVLGDGMFLPGFGFWGKNYDGEDELDYPGGIKTNPLHPGHGLAVGCVVASPGKGASGGQLRGCAPKAKVLPIRTVISVILNHKGGYGPLARALDKITRNDPLPEAHVVSISLGGIYAPSFLTDAIYKATMAGKIVIAAAGNLLWAHPMRVVNPGRDGNVICVGALDSNDKRWQDPGGGMGSCWGHEVTISAPGKDIMVASRNDKNNHNYQNVGKGSGTSYATAMVAGICAMWLAHHGRDNLIKRFGKAYYLKNGFDKALKNTCRRPPDWDKEMGYGVVDAEALLKTTPDLSDFSAEDLEPPKPFVHTTDNLISAGADPEMIAKLSAGDLIRFGNEILWQTAPSTVEDGVALDKPMSQELAARIG